MKKGFALYLVRLSPVLLLAIAASAYILHIEGDNAYARQNISPIFAVVVLAMTTLVRGSGRWTGSGWCWPLATFGFAIPAIGLSMYLHYGYAIDLNGMYSNSIYPQELFRYLPAYTMFAGGIGFAIGWIVGRQV